jgi:hypothetical protein
MRLQPTKDRVLYNVVLLECILIKACDVEACFANVRNDIDDALLGRGRTSLGNTV